MESLDLLCQMKPGRVPVTTVPVDAANTTGLLINLQNVLKKKHDLLQRIDNILKPEHCVIERLLFKHGGPFRREKVLFRLQQLKRLIKRYNSLAVVDKARTVIDLLGDSGFLEKKERVNIPSYLVCEELLLDMLKAAKLLHQGVFFCFDFRLCVEQKLDLRHYVSTMLGFLAVASRVWICCRSALITVIELYAAVRHFQTTVFRQQINEGTVIKLLKNHNLPDDLQILYPKEGPLPENKETWPSEGFLRPGYKLQVFRGVLTDDVIDAQSRDANDLLQNLREEESIVMATGDSPQQHLDALSTQTSPADTGHTLNAEIDLGVAISRTPIVQEPIEPPTLRDMELTAPLGQISKHDNVVKKGKLKGKRNKEESRFQPSSQKLKGSFNVPRHGACDNNNLLQFSEKNSSFSDTSNIQSPLKEYDTSRSDKMSKVLATNIKQPTANTSFDRSTKKGKKKPKIKLKEKNLKAKLNCLFGDAATVTDQKVHGQVFGAEIVNKNTSPFKNDRSKETISEPSKETQFIAIKPKKKKKKKPKDVVSKTESSDISSAAGVSQSKTAKLKKKTKRKMSTLGQELSSDFHDSPKNAKKRKKNSQAEITATPIPGDTTHNSHMNIRKNENTKQDNVKLKKLKKKQRTELKYQTDVSNDTSVSDVKCNAAKSGRLVYNEKSKMKKKLRKKSA